MDVSVIYARVFIENDQLGLKNNINIDHDFNELCDVSTDIL